MPHDIRDFALDYELSQDAAATDDGTRGRASAAPVQIPLEALSPSAAAGIIDGFILREGTDYGAVEVSHGAKVSEVRAQLERGEIVITFDPASESVTIIPRAEWARLERDGIPR